jgi:hypothetical protein
MQYMLLIYDAEKNTSSMAESANKEFVKRYFDYTAAMKEAGVLIAGDALQGIATATTVRVRQGDTATSDGPFAETKEQLGGYYLIDCENLDQALEWAAKCPSAEMGSIEVRPVMVWS